MSELQILDSRSNNLYRSFKEYDLNKNLNQNFNPKKIGLKKKLKNFGLNRKNFKARNMAKKAKVITKTALRRLMKQEADANIVSADAIASLMEWLQDTAITITKKALELTKHAKRKTVSKDDIKIALQSLK